MSLAPQEVDTELAKVVAGLSIPPCPAVLTSLLDETNKPEPDLAKVGGLIGRDVSLAASMLKTVNSPFYGLRTKATTVQQALTLLGLLNVTRMISGLLLKRAFPTAGNPMLEDYWKSSSSIALIAAHIAPLMGGVDRDEVYTFTLFRDCGIPLLATRMPGYTAFLKDKDALASHSFTDLEEIRFSVTHTEVGSLLAKEWLLRGPLVEALEHHHEYEALAGESKVSTRSRRLIATALAAEWLYFKTKAGDGLCHEWRKGGAFALATLQTTVPELESQRAPIAAALAEQGLG